MLRIKIKRRTRAYLTMEEACRRVADASACCLLPAAPTSALCRWAKLKLVLDENSGDDAPADFHRPFPWNDPMFASRLAPDESDPLLLVEATVVIRSADGAPPVVMVRASATYGCPLHRRSTAAVDAARARRRGHVLSLIVYCSPIACFGLDAGRGPRWTRMNGTSPVG